MLGVCLNMQLILSFLLSFFLASNEVDLTVKVNGFPSNTGQAYVALFNSEASFPSYGRQYQGQIVEIDKQTCKVTFKDLPPGRYAVAVYHDINKNKKLDKNVLGMPTESYGFSNNARNTFSAPSFADAAVNCSKTQAISIFVK